MAPLPGSAARSAAAGGSLVGLVSAWLLRSHPRPASPVAPAADSTAPLLSFHFPFPPQRAEQGGPLGSRLAGPPNTRGGTELFSAERSQVWHWSRRCRSRVWTGLQCCRCQPLVGSNGAILVPSPWAGLSAQRSLCCLSTDQPLCFRARTWLAAGSPAGKRSGLLAQMRPHMAGLEASRGAKGPNR